MSSIGRTLAAGVVALTLAAAAGASGAVDDFTIRGDVRIGPYRVWKQGSLHAAIGVFGRPTAMRRGGNPYFQGLCHVSWRSLGLSMRFYVLRRRNPCAPQHGCFFSALMTGKQWRTGRGLRIGDPSRRLYALYSGVRAHSYWRWLVTVPSPGAGSYPGLAAKLRKGVVVAFAVRAYTCGI